MYACVDSLHWEMSLGMLCAERSLACTSEFIVLVCWSSHISTPKSIHALALGNCVRTQAKIMHKSYGLKCVAILNSLHVSGRELLCIDIIMSTPRCLLNLSKLSSQLLQSLYHTSWCCQNQSKELSPTQDTVPFTCAWNPKTPYHRIARVNWYTKFHAKTVTVRMWGRCLKEHSTQGMVTGPEIDWSNATVLDSCCFYYQQS